MPPPRSLLLAPCVMWVPAEMDARCCPTRVLQPPLGIFPEMILKSACLVNLASLKMEENVKFPTSFQNSPHLGSLPSDPSTFSDCLGESREWQDWKQQLFRSGLLCPSPR